MRIVLGIVLAFLLYTQQAEACQVPGSPTESLEPVTIKISNTYFQIPEKYLSFYNRVSHETSYISFSPELNGRRYNLNLTKYDPNATYQDRPVHKLIFDDLAIITTTSRWDQEAIDALQLLSSKAPPPSWETDIALQNKLGLWGRHPCDAMDDPAYQAQMEALHPSYDDIKAASIHRYGEVRAKAMAFLGTPAFQNQDGTRELLLKGSEDAEPRVREVANRSLAMRSARDPSLVTTPPNTP